MPLPRLIGQSRAHRIIESMVRDARIPHALLFWGPAGVGKSVAAIELARWINCDTGLEGPCAHCESCAKFQALEHPHFNYLLPLPASALVNAEEGELTQQASLTLAGILKQKGEDPYRAAEFPGGQFILIGQVRSLLHWASIRSFYDKPRLALIEHADRLKEEAGNALLKLLEEPPPGFILILTAETPEDILPTLLSRCHLIEFERLSAEIVEKELLARGLEKTRKISQVVHLSGGNVSRALDFAEHPDQTDKLHDLAINLVRHSLGKSPMELNDLVEEWSREEFSNQSQALEIMAAWLRDAAVLRALGDSGTPRLIHNERIDLLKKFVTNCPQADFIRAAASIEQARKNLESNVLPPLALLVLARDLYRAIYQRKPV